MGHEINLSGSNFEKLLVFGERRKEAFAFEEADGAFAKSDKINAKSIEAKDHNR